MHTCSKNQGNFSARGLENPTQRLHLLGMNEVTVIIMRTGDIKSLKVMQTLFIKKKKKRIKKQTISIWVILNVNPRTSVSHRMTKFLLVILKNKNNGWSVRLQ